MIMIIIKYYWKSAHIN